MILFAILDINIAEMDVYRKLEAPCKWMSKKYKK